MSLPPSATNKRKRGAIATKVKAKEAKTAKSTLLICSLPRLNLPSLWQPDPYRGQNGGQYGGQHGAQNRYRPGPQYSSQYGGHYPEEDHPEGKTQKYSDRGEARRHNVVGENLVLVSFLEIKQRP
jgi:hypothetical protein